MAKNQLTAEQAKATTPDSSIWVTASAGTGKTHVLTSRVLRLLIKRTPPEKIVCLTFTKAAAAEMTNRIFNELGKWATYDDNQLRDEIQRLTLEKADDETLAYARTLFPLVLDLPGGIKIQTIHSFCQSMLGRFPIEAQLTPRFNVMDDRTANELIRSVIDQELLKATTGEDKPLLTAITHIARQVTEDGFTQLINDILAERRQFKASLQRYSNVGGLNNAIAQELGIDVSQSSQSLKASFLSAPQLNEKFLTYLTDAWREGTVPEKDRAQLLEDIVNTKTHRGDRWEDYCSLFLTQKMEPRARMATKGVVNKHPDIEEKCNQEAIRIVKCDNQLKLRLAFENTAYLNSLAATIINTYDDNKRRLGILDYDDLIMLSDRLISLPNIAPWILYKLDGGIDHILVDEAQDTNPEQWNLINSLSAEFFVGKTAREETRSVFAVGDAKQSIFGFQRADPQAFFDAKHLVEQRASNSELKFSSVPLNRSFRSAQAILNAVDAVFHEDKAGAKLTPEPELIRHKAHREQAFGMVEIWPVLSHDPENDIHEWTEPIQQKGYQAPERLLALSIAKRIERMIVNKEILEARNRPIEPRDIMVLVRRRTPFIDHLVQDLKERTIPVAGVDRMNLNDQLAVMDLIALGNFALLPDDDFNTACVLKSPFIGISEEALFELAHDRKTASVWTRLKARKSEFGEEVAFLEEILSAADQKSSFDYFSAILNKGGRKKLLARLGADANDPIDEFLNSARQYEMTHAGSLQGFLEWVTADDAMIKRDLDQSHNEVRIITVHSAKGLEAPIVFLPDTCAVNSTQNDSNILKIGDKDFPFLVWAGPRKNEVGVLNEAREAKRALDEIEHRRLLYVAMTRAEDRLYVAGWEGKIKRSERCWYELIANGMSDLPTTIMDDPIVGDIIRYQDGEALKVTKKSEDGEGQDDAISPPPDWLFRSPEVEQPSARPIAPSKIAETLKGDNPIEARDDGRYTRGTIIHRLLEILPEYPDEKRGQLTQQYLARPSLRLSEGEQHTIFAHIQKLLGNETFLSIIGNNSQAEVSITGKVESTLISAQIDRLYVDEKHVHIIDYKTNIAPAQSFNDVPPAYIHQLALYKKLLQSIYPHHSVECSLLWTENAQLMTLPSHVLDSVDAG